MPRLDSKLGKVEGALMELPIPIESIDAGLPVLGGAVGKSPGRKRMACLQEGFLELNQSKEEKFK
jgi:hypothetical protein